jgi:hypothetical protein
VPVGMLDLALCPFISAFFINTVNLMLVIYEINLLSLHLCFTECYLSFDELQHSGSYLWTSWLEWDFL